MVQNYILNCLKFVHLVLISMIVQRMDFKNQLNQFEYLNINFEHSDLMALFINKN